MADPTRPGQIPRDLTLVDLAEARCRHTLALADHRYGLAPPLGRPELAGHCLAVLAYSAALSERALEGRWLYAADALHAGAGVDQVAAALGLTVVELRAGLRGWAHGQARRGYISPEEHAQVLGLIAEGDQPDRGAGRWST